MFRIAIQPDRASQPSTSDRWIEFLNQYGCEIKMVNVYSPTILDDLRDCQGFMWRHSLTSTMRQVAHKLLPVIEMHIDTLVFPDQNTCWHYDDKIAQAFLFQALDIPSPKTWVFFDKKLALEWARETRYPVVMKLWGGAGSNNVRLIDSQADARKWIEVLFERGITGMDSVGNRGRKLKRTARMIAKKILGRVDISDIQAWSNGWDVHRNYALFQEFLPDNRHDTRITVIGDRAFGFRRFNRDNDFRASGSGRLDYTLSGVDPAFLRLGFEVADKLKMQSCAIDGLWRGKEAVTSEVSYIYLSSAIHNCPGHWDRDLNWQEGQMWPEQAHVEDFIKRLKERFG